MRSLQLPGLGLVLALGGPALINAAERRIQIPHGQTKPPAAAKSPAEAEAAFTVPDGFRVELAAAEPDVVNPVAMTWDDRGRIWVCESVQYPHREPRPGKDRIRILEDTDRDGRLDKVTTFAEGLNIPSGIAIGYGGVFVSNAPEILFLRDTNGDDVADTREVILDGFGTSDTHELPNTFTWGPDGWLYGLNGVFNPSTVKHQGRTWQFTCALWRYHPRTQAFEVYCQGTSNPWGLDYNANGHWFVSACVIDHLWHLTQTGYYHRQAGAYPPHVWKIESIVDHVHQKRAYCGLAFYDADVYPQEYRGDLFMGNIHGNCVNRDRLSRRGSTYRAEAKDDFLQANDVWFMPVSTKLGPDGCFWVLDWYDRYHCYQDAQRDPDGIDRGHGRLWRVAYGDVPLPGPFDLNRKSNSELIALLAHANGWWQRTAQRILIERNSESDVAMLKELARSSSPHHAPMYAVWTLIGMGRVDADFHLELLAHPEATFRAWGVRAACEKRTVSEVIFDKVQALAQDANPDVRIEVAIASSRLHHADASSLMLRTLSYQADDPLIPHIAWENLHPIIAARRDQVSQWLADETNLSTPGVREVAQRAIRMLLPHSRSQVTAFSALLEQGIRLGGDSLLLRYCLQALAEDIHNGTPTGGMNGRDLFAPDVREALTALTERDDEVGITTMAILIGWHDATVAQRARRLVSDARKPLALRLRLLKALAGAQSDGVLDLCASVLNAPDESTELRREAIASLQGIDRPEVGPLLLAVWPALNPELRNVAIGVLSSRLPWAHDLLKAVDEGRIPRTMLNTNHVRQMLRHEQPELTAAIHRSWGRLREERSPDRQRVLRRMAAVVNEGRGDPANGQLMFKKHCYQCHQIYGAGMDIGPDLTGNGRADLEQILSNVLDPNLVIGSGYIARTVWTRDGQVFNGIPVEDSPERIVLKIAGTTQPQVIPRSEIDKLRTSEISLMPEDLEAGLTEQEFRDLIAFLLTAEPPLPWEQVPDVPAGQTSASSDVKGQ